VVEASTDGGASFHSLTDTLGETATPGSYEQHRLPMAESRIEAVCIRFRVIAATSGSSGTLRIDDVVLEADPLHDLALRALEFVPALPGEALVARVLVANCGLLGLGPSEVRLGLDADGDSIVSPAECILRGLAPMAVGESLSVALEGLRAPERPALAMASVRAPDDRTGANDTVWTLFRPGVRRGSVVFNEIMYAPLAGSSEYLELALCAPYGESLAGWELTAGSAGAPPGSPVVFPETPPVRGDLVIVASEPLGDAWSPPGEGAGEIIAPGLVLRNDGGVLVLRDPSGVTCDSLQYGPSWHTPSVVETRGRSLEKLLPELPSYDARNWATCPDPAGGTPGRPNAATVRSLPAQASFGCSPKIFSPDGDGLDDWTLLRYRLPASVHALDLTVHDARGRMVRHLITRELGGPSGVVVWDGRDDAGETVRMGIYVVMIQATDRDGGELITGKAVVVVARKLR
jgi:hypothetical protein